MRVKHLTDEEIQVFLDVDRGDDLTLEESEIFEHLDSCILCRERRNEYVMLCGEAEQAPSIALPDDFARKVTIALPPHAAIRPEATPSTAGKARARILSFFAWCLIWSLPAFGLYLIVDWSKLIGSAVYKVVTGFLSFKAGLWAAISGFDPLQLASSASAWLWAKLPESPIDWTALKSQIIESIGEPGLAGLLTCAVLAILIVSSIQDALWDPSRENNVKH